MRRSSGIRGRGFDSDVFTAAVVVEYGAVRSDEGRLITRGDAEPWSILERVADGEGTAVGRVSFDDGSSIEAAVATGARQIGDVAFGVLRVDGHGRRVTLDWFGSGFGHLQDTQTWSTVKPLAASTANVGLGDLPGMNGMPQTGWQGLIYAGWFWRRWLSDSDVQCLARDPFAMFRRDPVRDLLLAAYAGGAHVWRRRRLWGSDCGYAGPAAMRPGGMGSGYASA